MQLILIGYGKMNRLVESLATQQGHSVAAKIETSEQWPAQVDSGSVAIDFSVPAAVLENLERSAAAGINSVIGTTGWYEALPRVRALVDGAGLGVVYGANFSVGVNAFYRIVASAARALPRDYDVFVHEAHHRHKRDAPSGTALRLLEVLQQAGRPRAHVASTRAGSIPGTHTVGFDGEADSITLTHTARSRLGFAEGALRAARWIRGRKGLYDFAEVFESMLDDAGAAR